MVERSAVNRLVVGSNPTAGAKRLVKYARDRGPLLECGNVVLLFIRLLTTTNKRVRRVSYEI